MISMPPLVQTVALQPLQETAKSLPIIGLDTALYMYQKHRNDKEYGKADAVRKRIEASEFYPAKLHVSFTGEEYRVLSKFNWNEGCYV